MDKETIIATIEQIAPPQIVASWDKSGIQVPCLKTHISSIAVCLDPTLINVQKAYDVGADMLISHHPLTLKPRFVDKEDSYLAVLRLLLQMDMLLYSAHTSLDANPEGPATWLPKALEMRNMEILEPTGFLSDGKTVAGLGFVGDVPALSLEKIFQFISCPYTRLIGAYCAEMRDLVRIAVCTGSGGELASVAKDHGAQLFITGDIKYHAALDAPLPILDVGHFYLEEKMMEIFTNELRRIIPQLSITFIPSEDPFLYVNTKHFGGAK